MSDCPSCESLVAWRPTVEGRGPRLGETLKCPCGQNYTWTGRWVKTPEGATA